mmetsp:Transcript_11680/g.27538  ORF Transcript_11680/g.27538 Transcript_11680/m.27538 type:complete len:210 (+) Transcript_11680:314-943(+)
MVGPVHGHGPAGQAPRDRGRALHQQGRARTLAARRQRRRRQRGPAQQGVAAGRQVRRGQVGRRVVAGEDQEGEDGAREREGGQGVHRLRGRDRRRQRVGAPLLPPPPTPDRRLPGHFPRHVSPRDVDVPEIAQLPLPRKWRRRSESQAGSAARVDEARSALLLRLVRPRGRGVRVGVSEQGELTHWEWSGASGSRGPERAQAASAQRRG